jgi:2-hydroxy-3-oxopropionate reductase
MPAPMARSLLKAGHRVRVYNRSPEKAQKLIADRADVAGNSADAAKGAQVVFIMVPDTPEVESVAATSRLWPTATNSQWT